ncbi:hypothetical protein C8R42DRAFT_304594 [Lentinula raphanica]|nr:hypothetical protein C8R42DRAFT_304594 [Lentinula raphanica]
MRFTKYFPLACALVSVVYAAPMTASQRSAALDTSGQTPPGPHFGVEIAFVINPLEGIHTHLTAGYTETVKENVRSVVRSIAARELGAPVGAALLFTWVGTPNPDITKPVKYKASTEKHGEYVVVMSQQNPLVNVVVMDLRGNVVLERGDPYKNS